MNEQELHNLWGTSEKLANKHYYSIRTSVEQMAQSKSENIIHEILKNSKMEIFFGLLIAIAVSFFYTFNYLVLALVVFSTSISLIITWRSYIKLKERVFKINNQAINEALKEYIQLIEIYVQNLKKAVYIFVPMMFYSAVFITFYNLYLVKGSLDWIIVILSIVIASIFLSGFLFLEFKNYIQTKYLNHLNELKDALDHLITQK